MAAQTPATVKRLLTEMEKLRIHPQLENSHRADLDVLRGTVRDLQIGSKADLIRLIEKRADVMAPFDQHAPAALRYRFLAELMRQHWNIKKA